MALIITSGVNIVTVAPDNDQPDIHIGGKVLVSSLPNSRVQIFIDSAFRKRYEDSISSITIDGQTPSDFDELGTMLATVFPDAGGDTGETTPETMDAFGIVAQSNGKGMGDSTLSPVPISNTVFQYWEGVLSEAIDPVANADTGSMWPAFGIRYNSMTNRKVCIMSAAVGASSIAPGNQDAGHRWDVGGTLFDTSVTKFTNGLAKIEEEGYTANMKGILMLIGEKDGSDINAAITTKAELKSHATTMIANFRTELGNPYLSFFIIKIGTNTSESDAGYATVREVYEELARELANVFIVDREFVNLPGRGGLMADTVHLNQAGLNERGPMIAEMVINRYAANRDFETALKDYPSSLTITFDVVAPTNSVNIKYSLKKVGRTVTFRFWAFWTTVNGSNGLATIPLPPDAPAPREVPSFTSSGARFGSGSGGMMLANSGAPLGNSSVQLGKDAAGDGYSAYVKGTAGACKCIVFSLDYECVIP